MRKYYYQKFADGWESDFDFGIEHVHSRHKSIDFEVWLAIKNIYADNLVAIGFAGVLAA